MSAHGTFEDQYRATSRVLLDYGCMVAPYLIGGEWNALRSLCMKIEQFRPSSAADRKDAERQLDLILENCVFHANYRAFYVHRMLTLPHLKEFSHLVERAVLHYFKEDYLSCMLCLLPAVEGALLSYAGWSFWTPKPSFKMLVARLRNGTSGGGAERRAMYAEAMASFLERWLYQHTNAAYFGLSYLNRHYALHGMGGETYYRATDCHRVILFFDVFADVLTLEGHGEKHVFIPTDIPEMERRRAHYELLTETDPPLRRVMATEEALLREHIRFVPELHPPRLEEIVARWAEIMGLA